MNNPEIVKAPRPALNRYGQSIETVPKGDAVQRYLEGIEAEAGLVNWAGRPVATAFWGGGTPGLLKAAEIDRLGRTMLRHCGGRPAEWTVELAPALPVRLRIGNASGTELQFRGQPVDLKPLARDNIANLTLP